MLRRHLTRGALAFLLAIGLLLGAAGPALAGNPIIGGGLGGSGDEQGNQEVVCPSGCPKVSKPPETTPPGTFWIYSTYLYADMGKLILTCSPKPDGRQPITVTARFLYWNGAGQGSSYDYSVKPGQPEYIAPSTWCNYQPASIVSRKQIICPTQADGAIVGPRGVTGVASRTVANFSAPSPWTLAGKPATGCPGAWNVSLSSPVTGDGYYDLNMNYYMQSCTVRMYSGTQPDNIQSCGVPQRTVLNKTITVSCTLQPDGWEQGQVPGVQFGVDACRNINNSPPSWSCTTAPLTFDGVPVSPTSTVLDDGVHRKAAWAGLQVGNVRNVRNERTQFTVDPRSTPFRDGALNQQPMEVALAQGENSHGMNFRVNGDQRDAWVGWQQSSLPGQPSVMNRAVIFDAQFPYSKVTITSVDLRTGTINATSTIVYVDSTGTCPSQPLRVQVLHGRTVN